MAELRYLLTILFFYAMIFIIQQLNPNIGIMQGFDMAYYGGEIIAIMVACGVPFVGGGTCAVAVSLTAITSFFVVTNYYINILFIIINVGLAYVMMRLSKGGG